MLANWRRHRRRRRCGSRRNKPLSRGPRRWGQPLTAISSGQAQQGEQSSARSLFTRPPGRDSGWRAGWDIMVRRGTSSSPAVFRLKGERGAQNSTGSTQNCCCGPCRPGFGASRACARWYRSPLKPMRARPILASRQAEAIVARSRSAGSPERKAKSDPWANFDSSSRLRSMIGYPVDGTRPDAVRRLQR